MLNPRIEKGSRVYDVRDRIDDLRRRLDELTPPAERFRARRAAVDELAPTPIAVSATEGRGTEPLRAAVRERLPTARATLTLPNGDDAMSLVSRAYDDTAVEDVQYGADEVRLTVRGRPGVVEGLRAAGGSIAVPEE